MLWENKAVKFTSFHHCPTPSKSILHPLSQIHANCRIRRVYFSDRLYSEDELPAEFKLYLPVQNKAKVRQPFGGPDRQLQSPPLSVQLHPLTSHISSTVTPESGMSQGIMLILHFLPSQGGPGPLPVSCLKVFLREQ